MCVQIQGDGANWRLYCGPRRCVEVEILLSFFLGYNTNQQLFVELHKSRIHFSNKKTSCLAFCDFEKFVNFVKSWKKKLQPNNSSSTLIEFHFVLTCSANETHSKDKQFTQRAAGRLWGKWCRAPLGAVEHIKDQSWTLIDSCLFGLTPSLKQSGLVRSLWPLNYRCSSSRSAGCAGTLFFLKDTTTHCGWEKKTRGKRNVVYHDQDCSFD